ncbi:CHAT domain-containing protein [Paludisphaera sp.]|uniref:CHAT domain-containing protein n=1 Tax=Paludisphaera sp. TaxID=2017432 RepID=UPI00301DC6F2
MTTKMTTKKQSGRAAAGANGATASTTALAPAPPSPAETGPASPNPVGLVPLPPGFDRGGDPPPRRSIRVDVEVVRGSIFEQRGVIAVVGRYVDTPPSGLVAELDGLLGRWLTKAIRLGIVSSDLGCLFHIPIQKASEKIANSGVILAGMGEAGCFSRDDLRYLATNIAYAIRGLGKRRFATALIGTGATGLPVDACVQSLLLGLSDGFARIPGLLQDGDETKADKADGRDAKSIDAMTIAIVEQDLGKCNEVMNAIDSMAKELDEQSGILVDAKAKGWERRPTRAAPKTSSPDAPPTRMMITQVDAGVAAGDRVVYQFAALGGGGAAVSARNQFLSRAFLDRLPERVGRPGPREEPETFGLVLSNYLIPEEYRDLLERDPPITLVLDEETARYPWEMAAVRVHGRVRFLGVEPGVTRQFRTLQSIAPGVPPVEGSSPRILVIADTCDGDLALPSARKEGLTVLKAATLARQARGDELDLRVTLRIGPADPTRPPLFDEWSLRQLIPGCEQVLESVGPCDPLEILSLLLDRRYDVVHYAGHGEFDEATSRKGWVFSRDCVLSADEILKVRQVPRLVFANACESSRLDGAGPNAGVKSRVSLAQAFFARGVPNYIGAAWPVDDVMGQRFAYYFYCRALGIEPAGRRGTEDAAPRLLPRGPDNLGKAMASARERLIGRDRRATWGAYQHYGQASSSLLGG